MHRNTAAIRGKTAKVDMRFEVVVIPVTDDDRSKAFYNQRARHLGSG